MMVEYQNIGIKKLHAKGNPSRPAMFPEFVVWKDGVDHLTSSVGRMYVMSMIKYFEKTLPTIPMFEDVRVEVDDKGNANYCGTSAET
eukprot:2327359-Rhodomonas_salina.2